MKSGTVQFEPVRTGSIEGEPLDTCKVILCEVMDLIICIVDTAWVDQAYLDSRYTMTPKYLTGGEFSSRSG